MKKKKEYGFISKKDSNYKLLKKDRLFFRSRGLTELQERFDENIKEHIMTLSKKQKTARILEIGFGEGKALLEMMNLSDNIICYGINDKKRPTLSSANDVVNNAKKFDISVRTTPKIFFYDAGNGLKFPKEYFDIVISQVAIHYVGNKAKLIEDVWRVLKKGGSAFLHVDSKLSGEEPELMYQCADSPRWIVYDGKYSDNKIIPMKEIFSNKRKKGFDITYTARTDKKRNRTILIHKNTSKQLKLNLEYDGNSTIYLNTLRNTDEYKFDTAIWWGTRSVYRLKNKM